MSRFRAEASILAVGAMMAVGALIVHGEKMLQTVQLTLTWLLAQAFQPAGYVTLSVGVVAILTGYAAGLPTSMTRYGGAPPKGALTKVLFPVCVIAALATATAGALTWLLVSAGFEHPWQPILVQLAQVLAGAVLFRCIFLTYRITSECRMAVRSANWP